VKSFVGEPRTSREALIAEMLGELDTVLARAEQLPKAVADAEIRIARTVAVLNDAGDKYRMAVTAFTEQARTELTEHLQRKALEAVARTVEEQRVALQDAARSAFSIEAAKHPAQLGARFDRVIGEIRCAARSRLLEHGVTAFLSSTMTAALVLWIVRLS
jgi:predicted lipid-binding transport protein (Tim44 family)